ncbi:MAG: FHA domain-containing protein [Anaerolineae bacterium]|nr:FHA domain-containing protein [Anaerolineae bacterium]
MMANYGRLVLISPDGTEHDIPLITSELTLGRDESNDIVLADPKVSRLHARVECGDQGCVLIDEGSANGTFVEGEIIERVTLHPGSLINLGNSTLRFEPPATGRRKRARPGTADRQLLHQFLDEIAQGPESSESLDKNDSLRDRLVRVPRLVIYTPTQTWEHRLQNQDRWTVGRSKDNDIVIDHQKVSRQHAQIEREGDAFVIRDLDSANGTFLGQQRIDQHTLRHADTLNVGHAQIIFKDVAQIDQAVAAPKTTHAPVIVVPGSLGSALWRGSEKIWPSMRTVLSHPEKFEFSPDNPIEARGIVSEVVVVPKLFEIESYDRIGNHLEAALGYTRGQDLLEFAYDWRGDVRLAAQSLAETVEQWDPAVPVVIIAHSLGCLVTRYYVDCLGGQRRVKRLILMGGPNYGGPTTPLMLLPDSLSLLPRFFTALGGALNQKVLRIFASFPVGAQMLPTYPAVFDQHGQPLDLYEDRSWLPPDEQARLQAGYELHQSLNHKATVPTTCIFGYGSQTITRLNVERDKEGRWQKVDIVSTSEGDGIVPAQSAILEGAEIHPVRQGHNQLYVDQDVLMRLNYELVG